MKTRFIVGIALFLLSSTFTIKFYIGLAQTDLKVHNINTGLHYATLLEAINAPETLDGHTIQVDPGIYYEHVHLNKALKLVGHDKTTTIIDGSSSGTVVSIASNNVTIRGFTIQNSGIILQPWFENLNKGIDVYDSDNVVIRDNIILNNQIGIHVYSFSDYNTLSENLIENNVWGISLDHSRYSKLRTNNVTENTFNFHVWGEGYLDRYIHDIDTSNTVNGKPLYYWINERDKQVPTDAGFIGLINSTNITVKDLNLSNNSAPLLLVYTTNSAIRNVVTSNTENALLIESSNNNVIYENTFRNIGWRGIRGGWAHIENSNGNKIYHNNFINNTAPWKVTNFNSANTWDNGSEGNYWSDYVGQDLNGDGIGDTLLPHHGVDWRPLMTQWTPVVTVPTQMLLIKVSGELDYSSKEDVKIRLTALVKDADTKEPVSNADVTIEIYFPNGTLWVSDNMVEKLIGTGIYEWESSKTIYQMKLKDGVYIVYVKASINNGPVAYDILEFHIDQPQEEFGSPASLLVYYAVIVVIVLAGVSGVIFLRRFRKHSIKS